jgi:thymidine phosphorylase
MARDLADSIVAVAAGAGLPTTALITDMDQVLGSSVGNALEVAETVSCLTAPQEGDARLREIVLALAAEMLVLGGLAASVTEGRAQADARLADGRAAETFARMVRSLGGPADILDCAGAHLPQAPVVRPCPAPRAGTIAGMDGRAIGLAVVGLGGGRRRASDAIDPAVGLTQVVGIGRAVAAGEPLALVHAADEASAGATIAALQAAIRIGESAPAMPPVVRMRIDGRDATVSARKERAA